MYLAALHVYKVRGNFHLPPWGHMELSMYLPALHMLKVDGNFLVAPCLGTWKFSCTILHYSVKVDGNSSVRNMQTALKSFDPCYNRVK